VTAVAFSLLAAVSFGALPLLVRRGLALVPERAVAALVQNGAGLVVCGAAALAVGDLGGDVVPFLLIGLVVPGLAQLLLVRAVSLAGPARVSVFMNTSPLLSVVIAYLVLGEPFHVALLGGCVLVVLGSLALAAERSRPVHVRAIGLVLAIGIAVCFAARDNLVRHYATHTGVHPILAAALVLVSGTGLSLLFVAVERPPHALERIWTATRAYTPAGIALGVAYVGSFEAFYHGRVTVVAPLIGTASFFAVVFAAVLLGRTEGIGRHVVLGTVLIVAGGALIAGFR
jgi:drug/metabolite transporter (DMT)-like permease